MNIPAADLECPLCHGAAIALPCPSPTQSIVSDGRILQEPLRKMSCVMCGSCSHQTAVLENAAHALYDKSYRLPTDAPASDALRAKQYARWLMEYVRPASSVLEAGCGSGALLRELASAWPATTFLGVDPATTPYKSADYRIELRQTFLDLSVNGNAAFDLIIAVNVIEHTHDPIAFFAALAARLQTNGTLVIVCPSEEPPSVELLFHDHLWTLTPSMLSLAGKSAGLRLVSHDRAPRQIGNFQISIFRFSGRSAPVLLNNGELLTNDRRDYLQGWQSLDDALEKRAPNNTPLFAFGAGQTAALLRAYAPKTWVRVQALIMDDVSEAWALDRPFLQYSQHSSYTGLPILIAAAPTSQAAIATRISNDGFWPIRWDDLISY